MAGAIKTSLTHAWDTDVFDRYTLSEGEPAALPAGTALILNTSLGVMTLVRQEDGEFLQQQLFSPSEMYLVEVLFKEYPDYCPYEVALSVMTGQSVEACRQRIYDAQEQTGSADYVLRPIRNVMGRTREKLHLFGVDVHAQINFGYTLGPYVKKERRHHVALR